MHLEIQPEVHHACDREAGEEVEVRLGGVCKMGASNQKAFLDPPAIFREIPAQVAGVHDLVEGEGMVDGSGHGP